MTRALPRSPVEHRRVGGTAILGLPHSGTPLPDLIRAALTDQCRVRADLVTPLAAQDTRL